MTTTRRGYVFGTFLSSCAALVLLIVSCATNVWISSDIAYPSTFLAQSKANYGLFRGTFEKPVTSSNTFTFDIRLVCDFGENICSWSCQSTSENRKKELAELLQSIPHECLQESSRALSARTNGTHFAGSITRAFSKGDFMNAGLYLSTVIMLMLALLATTAATLLAVINAASNPTLTWLAVDSLYYWNGAAGGLDLLCLILWGTHFATSLKDNIGLTEVISQYCTSKDLAQLGWSYWLVLVALLISWANVGVLFWRDYLIRKIPPPPTWNPEKDATDGTLILY